MNRITPAVLRVLMIVLMLLLIPLGFWLDVQVLRFYAWMGWL